MLNENNVFPLRINKYLALQKISTRKGADGLIIAGKVFINGKKAKLGDKVEEKDLVEVKGIETQKYKYLAYNKPVGIETTSPEKDLFPIGRLDKASHGLLILTNDGRITDRLLNPKFFHEKEYLVTTTNKLRSSFQKKMESGVNIEGYMTKKCKVNILNDFNFKITLTEGKKHQIRRMCSALFQEITDLKRIRVINIKLGTLKEGKTREIIGRELNEFLSKLEIPTP